MKMKDRYGSEVPAWLRALGACRVLPDSVEFKWGYFAPCRGFEISVNRGGYFDRWYSLDLCLVWGKLNVKLPFKTKLEGDCEWPQYGISLHHDTLWIHTGGPGGNGGSTSVSWYLPFFSWEFKCHLVQQASGKWVPADRHKYEAPYSDNRHIEVHPYTYKLASGTIQKVEATIYKERRQWHRKWFPFLKKSQTDISIGFSDEIGEGTGSWKGGTVGCWCEVEGDEPMMDTLKRMECEREFNR